MTQPTSRGIALPIVVIIALIAFAVGAGVGILGYVTVMGGSGEASTDITNVVPTLPPASEATPVPTEVPAATDEAAATPDVMATEAMEATAETAAADTTAEAVSASGAAATFSIDPAQSSVSFTLDEDLRGVRTTVVGTTQDIGGEIRVDTANPANSQVGGIVINARTIATDNDFRNRAIRSEILRSAEDAYEFINFTPTSITGLPTTAAKAGDTLTFQVTGDLKIIEITKPVTFDVTVTLDSATQISGTATTTVKRSDFNLNIPSVPMVANVTDEVQLAITFVAAAK